MSRGFRAARRPFLAACALGIVLGGAIGVPTASLAQEAPPPGSVTVVGAASASSNSSATVTLPVPEGTQAGDIIAVATSERRDCGDPPVPEGMGLVNRYDGGVLDAWLPVISVFGRVATGDEGPITVAGSGMCPRAAAVIVVLRGVVVGAAFDGASSGSSPAGSWDAVLSVPGLTTVTPNARLLLMTATANQPGAVPVTGPSEMNALADTASSGTTLALFDEERPTPGPTGDRTADMGQAGQHIGVLLALRPAPAETGPPPPTGSLDVVGSGHASSSSGFEVTLPAPLGTMEGDLILVAVADRHDCGLPPVPTGMVLVGRFDGGLTDPWLPQISLFGAYAPAHPGIITVQGGGACQRVAAAIEVVRGVDRDRPLDAWSQGASPAGSWGTSLVAPGVTTTVPGSHLALFTASVNSALANEATAPEDMTELADTVSPGTTLALFDEERALPGPTGDRVATMGQAGQHVALMLALAPGEAGPAPEPPEGPVSVVGSDQASSSSSSATVPIPAGTAPGDVIVVGTVDSRDCGLASAPAGLTLLGRFDGGQSGSSLPVISAFGRVATGSEGPITVENPGSCGRMAVTIVVLRGVDLVHPLDGAVQGSSPVGSFQDQLTLAGITTTSPDARVVMFTASVNHSGPDPATGPAEMTPLSDTASSGATIAVFTENRPTPGSTGPRVTEMAQPGDLVGLMFAVRPPGANTEPPPEPEPGPEPSPDATRTLGLYRGSARPDAVDEFEAEVLGGQHVPILLEHTDMSSWDTITNNDWFLWLWAGTGRRLVITPTPFPWGGSLQEAASGAYDGFWRTAMQQIVDYGFGDAVLRIGHEFNCCYPWDATPDTASYRAMFRRYVDIARSILGQEFRFDWNPLVGGTMSHEAMDAAYPGDDVVDIIGLDVYDTANFGPTPEARWDTLLHAQVGLLWQRDFAAAHGKWMSFPEWGPAYHDHAPETSGGDNAYFVSQMEDWIAQNNVLYHVSYNHDNPEFQTDLLNGRFPESQTTFNQVFRDDPSLVSGFGRSGPLPPPPSLGGGTGPGTFDAGGPLVPRPHVLRCTDPCGRSGPFPLL